MQPIQYKVDRCMSFIDQESPSTLHRWIDLLELIKEECDLRLETAKADLNHKEQP